MTGSTDQVKVHRQKSIARTGICREFAEACDARWLWHPHDAETRIVVDRV
jgi:hypothetical protein